MPSSVTIVTAGEATQPFKPSSKSPLITRFSPGVPLGGGGGGSTGAGISTSPIIDALFAINKFSALILGFIPLCLIILVDGFTIQVLLLQQVNLYLIQEIV